jgi:hypothetical protein
MVNTFFAKKTYNMFIIRYLTVIAHKIVLTMLTLPPVNGERLLRIIGVMTGTVQGWLHSP